MLHLPHVAELVCHEVVGDVGPTEEDDAMGREPVVATPRGQAKEPRRDDDPDPVDPYGPWPPVEPVEAFLRRHESPIGLRDLRPDHRGAAKRRREASA